EAELSGIAPLYTLVYEPRFHPDQGGVGTSRANESHHPSHAHLHFAKYEHHQAPNQVLEPRANANPYRSQSQPEFSVFVANAPFHAYPHRLDWFSKNYQNKTSKFLLGLMTSKVFLILSFFAPLVA